METGTVESWQSRVAFAPVRRVRGEGDWLLLAGVGSEASEGVPSAPGDIEAQCSAAWAAITETLAREGAGVEDIVRARTYVVDPRYLPYVTAARRGVFQGRALPIHTFVVVSQLAVPEMLVEVEVDAFVPRVQQ